jgi:hypothetical protein
MRDVGAIHQEMQAAGVLDFRRRVGAAEFRQRYCETRVARS